MSEMALRLRLAVAMTSSCWPEFPAATDLAVATVMPLVMRMSSSGVANFSRVSLDWKTYTEDNSVNRGVNKSALYSTLSIVFAWFNFSVKSKQVKKNQVNPKSLKKYYFFTKWGFLNIPQSHDELA